jgi:hypothetical protein
VTGVGKNQPHARVEEGELAKAVLEPLEIELDDLKVSGLGRKVTRVPFFPSGAGPTTLSGATASPKAKRM